MKTNPLITILLPAYNEAAIIENNIEKIRNYLISLENKYSWEIVIINDGSKDNTGQLADKIAAGDERISVYHHPVNLNLGRALQTGFKLAKGSCIIVIDIDLSYSVDHIEKMADTLFDKCADVVVASPYMRGGKVTAVPFMRAIMSRFVNLFMRMASQEKFCTFTGMVRAYNAKFIRTLNLKTKDYEINPEIIYKSMILRARIIEIPAHLDWTELNKMKGKRASSMRIIRGVFSGMMSGFIFRPYIFFIGVGGFLFLLSLYIIGWLLVNTFAIMPEIVIEPEFFDDRFSYAVAKVYKERPHAFFVGGFTLLLAIQFFSLGFLSLQSKRYFEELFHFNTNLSKKFNNSGN